VLVAIIMAGCLGLLVDAATPAGFEEASSSRLQGSRLLLPEIGGHIDAPGPEWKWLAAIGRSSSFRTVGPKEQGGVYDVTIEWRRGPLNEEHANNVARGMRASAEAQAVRVVEQQISDETTSKNAESGGSFRVKQKLAAPTLGIDDLWRVVDLISVPRGRLVVIAYMSVDGREPPGYLQFRETLRFMREEDNDLRSLALWTLPVGGIGALLVLGINRLTKRKVLGLKTGALGLPLMLVAVQLGMAAIIDGPYETGRVLAGALPGLVVLLVFVLLIERWARPTAGERRAARSVAMATDGSRPTVLPRRPT